MLNFIKEFHRISPTNNIDEVFTCGFCYWFANILSQRFDGSEIMYDPIGCHFMVRYKDRLYDITGDVTEQYSPVLWSEYKIKEPLGAKRVIKNCVLKEE